MDEENQLWYEGTVDDLRRSYWQFTGQYGRFPRTNEWIRTFKPIRYG